MINPRSPMRRHTRFPVSWHVLYGSDEFLAEGTVLDLTARGWRVAGSMPVVPGMELRLQVSVPDKSEPLHVERATVLWVRRHDFAIEAHGMASTDQAWVTEFLRHKLGLRWMSPITSQAFSRQALDKAPGDEAYLPQPSVPSIEEVLQRLLVIETAEADMPIEMRWNGDPDIEKSEDDAPCHHVPEATWLRACRILRGMRVLKETRAGTGRDPSVGN